MITDALQTVLPDRSPQAGTPSTSVFLDEVACFQLAFRPPDEARVGRDAVRVELSGPAAPYATVSAVDLVPAQMPAFPDHDDNYLITKPGLYPDVLRPAPDGVIDPIVGCWRSCWIDVLVPDGALPAGGPSQRLELGVTARHVGSGEVLFRGAIELTVINRTLPPLDIVNVQWLHADCLVDYYGDTAFDDNHWRALDSFVASAARMNITGLLAPVWTPPLDTGVGLRRTPVQLLGVTVEQGEYRFDFTRLERWLQLLGRHGIRQVEIAHLFTQWGATATPAIDAVVDGEQRQIFGWHVAATDPEYRRFLEALLPQLRAFLAEHWDESRVLWHISDEPSASQLDSYAAARSVVADLLDGCTIVDALSDFSFYTQGVVDHPIVATDHAEPFLAAGVERLWVYYCVSQNKDVANRFIGMPPARHRIIGQQLFAADCGGFLHWGFNFYNAQYSTRPINPFADTCAGGAFPAGDPFIVYPGPGRVAWESTRHRVAAQAMNDHRALQLLRDLGGIERATVDVGGVRTFRAYGPGRPKISHVRAQTDRTIVRLL